MSEQEQKRSEGCCGACGCDGAAPPATSAVAEDVDLEECVRVAVRVARAAGAEIRKGMEDGRAQSTAGWKGTADLVTEVDKRVERLVFAELRARFPGHAMIGEETASSSECVGDGPTWVVDPIDGTTNFVHGDAQVCVSIALFVGRRVSVGVVFNPVLGELFTAVRGKGAFLTRVPTDNLQGQGQEEEEEEEEEGKRERLRVSKSRSLKEAVVGTNVGCRRDAEGIEFVTGNVGRVLGGGVLGMRMGGSAAMALASVACGRLCAFYEWNIHIWDFAAGVLLVEEAGGKVCCPNTGGALDFAGRCVLGGAAPVVDDLLRLLRPPAAVGAAGGGGGGLARTSS